VWCWCIGDHTDGGRSMTIYNRDSLMWWLRCEYLNLKTETLKRATHHHLFIVVTRNYSMTIMPTLTGIHDKSDITGQPPLSLHLGPWWTHRGPMADVLRSKETVSCRRLEGQGNCLLELWGCRILVSPWPPLGPNQRLNIPRRAGRRHPRSMAASMAD
jgi:hypothetical protein